jgi:hypothetical protein
MYFFRCSFCKRLRLQYNKSQQVGKVEKTKRTFNLFSHLPIDALPYFFLIKIIQFHL